MFDVLCSRFPCSNLFVKMLKTRWKCKVEGLKRTRCIEQEIARRVANTLRSPCESRKFTFPFFFLLSFIFTDDTIDDVIEDFDLMGLSEPVLRGIYNYGFEKPSAIQQRGVVPASQGRDVIGQAQSGTGKTATFAIGLLSQIDPKLKECQVGRAALPCLSLSWKLIKLHGVVWFWLFIVWANGQERKWSDCLAKQGRIRKRALNGFVFFHRQTFAVQNVKFS